MSNPIIEQPTLVGVTPVEQTVVVLQEEPAVAVRLLETGVVEAERREIVSVEQPDAQVHVLAVGPQGPPGVAGAGGGGLESYTAGATVNGHRVIVTNASGQAVHADNATAAHANAATKISVGAALVGQTVQVQLVGRITEPSWSWTPGGTIYVGADGVLTQTTPVSPAVFSKVVAVAETATRILIVQESPVILI